MPGKRNKKPRRVPGMDEKLSAAARRPSRIEFALLKIDTVDDIYRYVARSVKDIIGAGITAVTSLDASDNSMRFVSAEGLPVALSAVSDLFGIDPTRTVKRVDEMTDIELSRYRTGTLEPVTDGLFGLLEGYVPKTICTAAARLLGARFVYTIGFIQADIHLGGLFILSPADIARHKDAVESIVNRAAFILQRKRAEKALEERQKQLDLAISGSGVGMWDWYIRTGRTIFNERWAEMIGYTLAELSPISIDTWKRLTHPADLAQSTMLIEKHFKGQSPMYECEMRMKHKDGHWVWILDRGAVAERDADGEPLRMTGTHLDITDRKNAEVELYKRAYELEFLSLTAMGFVNLKPNDDIYAFITEKLRAMLPGFSIVASEFSEPEGMTTVKSIYAPGAVLSVAARLLKRKPEGMRTPIPADKRQELLLQRIVTGPKGIFDIAAGTIPEGICTVLDGLLNIGTIYGMGFASGDDLLGNVVLISPKGTLLERIAFVEGFIKQASVALLKRRAERSLAESEARYRSIFENIQDVYYEATPAGIITEVSPSVERFTRYQRSELIGKSLYDVYARPADRDAVLALLLKDGRVSDHEIRLKDKDGRTIECSLSAFVSFDGNNKPKMVSGTLRDISERKRTEAMLVQTDKLRSLGVLASGVAHEINQPLMALSLAIDNVRIMYEGGRMTGEYFSNKMDSMQGYIKRVKNIIEQVRLFSRDQSAAGIADFSVDEAVDNVLSMVETQYKSRGITIVRERGEVPPVRGNLFKFEQVVVNLLSNAKDAIEKAAAADSGFNDRIITIRTLRAESAVRLEIRDNGPGMSDEVRKNIFTPFYTTKQVGEGTGLGLSITYGIVKAMGGDITFESVVGKFTQVTVSVPAG